MLSCYSKQLALSIYILSNEHVTNKELHNSVTNQLKNWGFHGVKDVLKQKIVKSRAFCKFLHLPIINVDLGETLSKNVLS